MTPLLLVVSPHCDDAVFSVGGLLQRVAARAEVLNLFTRAIGTRSGRMTRVSQVSALRAAEDRLALATLGVRSVRSLGLPEALLRGYPDLNAVFHAPLRPADRRAPRLRRLLFGALTQASPALVLAPLGVGNHVDHRLARDHSIELCRALEIPFALYEDLPYAAPHPRALVRLFGQRVLEAKGRWGPGSARLVRVPMSQRALQRKRRALSAYRSQLGPGDWEAVAAHASDGARLWERLHCPPGPLGRRALAALRAL